MKHYLFLLRDPGAYAAIYPVFLHLSKNSAVNCTLFCFGTAAKLNGAFSISERDAQNWVQNHIRDIDILICGTGFSAETELSIMESCQNKGIRTVAILDYWSNYKERFFFHNNFLWPDTYIVMDKLAKQEAVIGGVPESIIKVLGHPGLDEVLHKNGQSIREIAKENREYSRVLLLGEPMSGRTDLGYNAETFFANCIEVLNSLHKEFSIKFHPRDDFELQKRYSAYRVDGDLLDIASKQDIVIGMTTIALLHCSLLGKPTISYQPGLACKDGCISNKLGLSKLIVSREELLVFLSHPVFERKNGRNDLIWLDGKSTERIARFLMDL